MKILLVTNIVSHHQLPLARELCKLIGVEDFLFAATEDVSQERIRNGWQDCYSESWIIHPNNSIEEKEKYERFWNEADAVLCGERLIDRMQKRVNNNKLCFYMSERWWKPPIGILRLCHPKFLTMFLKFRQLSQSKHFHYLPTGPFAKKDLARLVPMPGRVWDWGYFTEMSSSVRKKGEVDFVSVLWVGRMLKWKNLDLLIKVLAKLKGEGKKFKLTLVGEGPERIRLENIADELLGEHYFTIHDFIPSSKVTKLMSEHDIYVLPSNSYEGWGAVVNEAMSVGCAVIASDKTGAGASMIEHGINGLLFQSGSKKSLYKELEKLICSKGLVNILGCNARQSVINKWQPSEIAKYFVLLAISLNSSS